MRNTLLLANLLVALAACAETTSTHGQVILPSRLNQVQTVISTKADVMQLLGSPSTTATMADNRWVYISTVVVNKPLDQKTLQKRQVIVIDFDPSGTVAGITDKSAADGKTIEPDSSQTKTYGQSLGILDSVMENMGSLGGK